MDPHREPTSDEILDFSDDGTIFGYIEVLDTLGPIASKKNKNMGSTSFIWETLELMATDLEKQHGAYSSLHIEILDKAYQQKGPILRASMTPSTRTLSESIGYCISGMLASDLKCRDRTGNLSLSS